MNREYHNWYSPRLNREMELLVFGHSGARVVVFPTRAGRFFDYENFGMVECIRDRIESGAVQLFCVDSVDSESLYARNRPAHERIQRHMLYESYILEEVVPLTVQINGRSHLVAHGCSFGAFHAVNIAFRHPGVFQEVVALSGRYEITRQMGPFTDLFDGYYDDEVYFNNPNHYIPNLEDQTLLGLLRRMRIVLVVGSEDPFYENNLALSQVLQAKRIPHELHVWSGEAHRPRYWRSMVRLYLMPE
jgi:esterase/lipase superfamily enzyme